MARHLIRVVIAAAPPERLDKALARDVPGEAELSRSRLARMIAEGAVARDGVAVTDIKARVAEGETYEITVDEAEDPDTRPEAIPLSVVYEDDELIVVDKPAGMVVHPAPGTPGGTLVNALLHHFGGNLSGVGGEKRPGIVHRIDKDTSGLLVAAKTDRAHHALAAQFEKHSADRRYLALCHGVPDAADPRLQGHPRRLVRARRGGEDHHPACPPPHRPPEAGGAVPGRPPCGDAGPGGRRRSRARWRWWNAGWRPGGPIRSGCTWPMPAMPWSATRPMAAAAAPPPRCRAAAEVNAFPRQALHAAELGFDHPASGERMHFEAPLPADMAALLAALRGNAG